MRTSLAWDQRRGGRATVEARKHRRRRWRLQPSLLALEDRRLLSTFTVNSTGDTGTGSGLVGDLRYCITQANAAGGPETITFDKTVFQTPQTITGTFELSDTTGTETILGPVAGVTISGGGNGNVFQVNRGVTATLSGLTITDANGSGVANYGTEIRSPTAPSAVTTRPAKAAGWPMRPITVRRCSPTALSAETTARSTAAG